MEDALLNRSDLESILEDVSYKGDAFRVSNLGEGWFIQHLYKSIDSLTGEARLCKGRKWYISPYSCRSEVVLTALKAVITNAEHEAREAFKYKGKTIFGPHMNVDKLFEFCDNEEYTEGRD